MIVRKSDDFIADIERQFEWYVANGGWEVADRFLDAVEAACGLIASHPLLGPRLDSTHPRLKEWRYFVILRPFHMHLLFYEADADGLILRRSMHGHRNLPQRLLDTPEEG